MTTLRAVPRTLPRIFVVVLCLHAAIVAASSDSLRMSPIGVQLALPDTLGPCFEGADHDRLADRLRAASDSTRYLRLDSAGFAVLALTRDSTAGRCGLSLTFQDPSETIVARGGVLPGETVASSDVLERLTWQISEDIGMRAGAVEISTTPSGARVWLAGLEVGATPLRVDGLLPGRVPMRIELSDWAEVAETLSVRKGRTRSVELPLERSRSWLDSVRHVALAIRSDSVWKDARMHPVKDLPDLFDRLALGVATDPWVSVAILPFDVFGGQTVDYEPGTMVAEYGIARWKRDPRFVVLRREVVRRFLKADSFAQAGVVADSATAEMGKLVAARYVVTGAMKIAGGKQVLGARMVSVRTGEIVSAAVVEMSSAEVEDLYRDALGEKGHFRAAVSRSLLAPGWGQFHEGYPVHGGVVVGSAVASIGFALWAYFDYSDKDDELRKYRDYDPSTVIEGEARGNWWRRAEAARTDRNDAQIVFNVALGVAGGVWIANVIDAGIVGYMESRRIRPKYYAFAPSAVARPDGLALAWRF